MADEEWIYRIFGLITPYLSTKSDYKEKFEQILQNYIYVNMSDRLEVLSLSARSMWIVLANQSQGEINWHKFSQETLENICHHYCDEEDDNKPQNKEEIIKYLNTMMSHEIEAGNYVPEDYPLLNLNVGILFNGNWKYLSDSDLEKWATGYGYFYKDVQTSNRQDMVKYIVRLQDVIFLELMIQGFTSNLRGVVYPQALINFNCEINPLLAIKDVDYRYKMSEGNEITGYCLI